MEGDLVFPKMSPIGLTYKVNRIGPKIKLCGTPDVRFMLFEVAFTPSLPARRTF